MRDFTNSRAKKLVPQYLKDIDDTSQDLKETAQHYAERSELKHPINRAPSTVAASAIYFSGLMLNEKLTQETVLEACDVNHHSLRECYREIADYEIDGMDTNDENEVEQDQGFVFRLLEVLR